MDDATANVPVLACAIWFHDAVYGLYASDNEEKSADLARDFLTECDVDPKIAARVADLVICTKTHEAKGNPDAELMVDIDLSILGADSGTYDQFERDVRAEYRSVPGFIFSPKRKKILKRFLDRPRIYHTQFFRDRLETQAGSNLNRAIAGL
ncbi:MAG: hypothetical protein AAGE03_08055 [Pseudomonadota bacterium]